MHRKQFNSISRKFTALVTGAIVVSVATYLFWCIWEQDTFTIDKALAEARTLNVQMESTWDYIDNAQNAINYNSDGSYDFKGIYCASAGKEIALRFTRHSDGYQIRYVRENPRSGTDVPDAFELAALELFATTAQTEHYAVSEYDGRQVFRYVSRLNVSRGCLSCHGEPQGEKDQLGFYKEGYVLGDIAGATSIVIPLSVYQQSGIQRIVATILFFIVLLAVMVLVVRFGLRKWITGPLSKKNELLEVSNKAKDDVLTTVSHELRTPLSSIMAFADLLDDDSGSKTPEEQRVISEIKLNSKQLFDMVNNMIDTARVDAGRFDLEFEEIDLVDDIEAVASLGLPLAAEKNITLVSKVDTDVPLIVSDWSALRRILTNLIGNAIKFTPQGGTVSIDACMMESAGGGVTERVAIKVVDTGCGIARQDLKRVFMRFEQAQTGRGVGSGLGLALSKNLAELLGGSLTVSSIVGEGSTFTLVLPVVPVERSEGE